MLNDSSVMKTALRVLNAITQGRPPRVADVEELRRFAPLEGQVPVDELACEVVQEALIERSAARRQRTTLA